MTKYFKDFSATFEQFVQVYPDHPLADEIRSRIMSRRFPSDEWLQRQTLKMKELLEPAWREVG